MEFILSAAIHYDDGKYHKEQAKNIISGIIICGRRHSNCYAILEALRPDLKDNKLLTRENQGFITSKGRYVNRKEGYEMAKAAKQIHHCLHDDIPELISEDLY